MNALNKIYDIPKNTHLQLHHLHSGNSTTRQRKGHQYVTVAILKDNTDDKILAQSTASCSKRDVPNRSRGRDIAVGRVLKQHKET